MTIKAPDQPLEGYLLERRLLKGRGLIEEMQYVFKGIRGADRPHLNECGWPQHMYVQCRRYDLHLEGDNMNGK